ncbi:acyl-CoA dehydrogenase family protein [Nocardioides sp. zg-1228]|uniref:acyl-CoA dehydrogenase family protein n=1 Tax=Nocardioides sp. zg-1228 TaxID=2763008 RepID=UPI001642CEEB|nr:acyl-CoA dehydrogenase family protein [Nocardioides sp. zg-1228]MBC2932093.1 acyl-CoA dehydrogenase family protein [Nocardioides sp. zg-1228]QSF57641.1 acyl-CoA dehydrogenase family protein [Nocardioides sp. zg-1228]
MDLRYTDQEDAFRAEVRGWLAENVPRTPLPSGDTEEGFAAHVGWERTLFQAGWSAVSWPREYGGRDASLWEWLIFEEEYARADAPARVTQNGIFLLAPTVFEFGTPEQQRRILPRMAAAEDLWAQGWSEPGAGSDLASVRSRAVRDDDAQGWRVSGQKTWSTRGGFCTHLFGLFRTDPESARHRGLTYLLVPLDAPGVTVRPFPRLDGDPGFADVFFDDVLVPDRDVLGGVGEGWRVAMSTTGSERGLTLRSPGRFRRTVARLLELAEQHPERVSGSLHDRLVEAWMDAEAYQLFTLRQVTQITEGHQVGAESSLNKVFWSEMDVRLHEIAMELLGAEAQVDSVWPRGFQFALGGTIYAGTNEIQRNIISERILKLPRK